MENKLSCGIVRDLLPSYVEGLTCEETNTAVEKHLSDCDECRAVFQRMQEPEEKKTETSEVDYLKKVRRRGIGKALLIAVLLLVVGAGILSYRVFWIGYEIDASYLEYQVKEDGKTIQISGDLGNSDVGISRIEWHRENGVVDVSVYAAPKTFLSQSDFHTSVTLSSVPLKQIRLNGRVLWENEKIIDPIAADLYESRNPYVGDMSANGKIAQILGISKKLGSYKNELQTSEEPYGWKMILSEKISADDAKVRDVMRMNSYALLANVGNLGYVSWVYESDTGMEKFIITAEEATEFTGADIKSWSESVSELQELCEMLNII